MNIPLPKCFKLFSSTLDVGNAPLTYIAIMTLSYHIYIFESSTFIL